jgi:cytochrome c556
MKKLTLSLSLILGLCSLGFAQDEDAYKSWMKATPGHVGGIRKNLEAKAHDAVVTDAKKLENIFGQSAEFWTKKGVSDAAGWSKDAQAAAAKLATAAAAGDADGAAAAFKSVTGSCKGCHEAHRDKLADGSYKLK